MWELPPAPERACDIPRVLSPGRYRVPKSLAVLAFRKLFLMLHPISCWPCHDGGPLKSPVPSCSRFLLGIVTCRPEPKVFLRLFFAELVPTPLEQPGRRVHPTFQMLMKVFQQVNDGQRPGDITWPRCGLSSHIPAGGNTRNSELCKSSACGISVTVHRGRGHPIPTLSWAHPINPPQGCPHGGHG